MIQRHIHTCAGVHAVPHLLLDVLHRAAMHGGSNGSSHLVRSPLGCVPACHHITFYLHQIMQSQFLMERGAECRTPLGHIRMLVFAQCMIAHGVPHHFPSDLV